jgi:hypothetical protein
VVARREREKAIVAASEAIVVILGSFREAHKLLASRYQGSVSQGQGGDSVWLDLPGHTVHAARDGGDVVISVDGEPTRFTFCSGVFADPASSTPLRPRVPYYATSHSNSTYLRSRGSRAPATLVF